MNRICRGREQTDVCRAGPCERGRGPGAIWARMSTMGVAGTDAVAALAGAERPDVMLRDAPVSGSKDPAEHGQLTIFASGPAEARSRIAPLFSALGQRTIWAGETG